MTDWWREPSSLETAREHGLNEQEFQGIREVLGTEVSNLEVGVCSALFSEHCSYKSSKRFLRTLPSSGQHVLQGPGENAGAVDIGEGLAAVFKIESHNHPSYIEPFQGAATGVGGILRDIFTMGARPIALMNALRFGEPAHHKTAHLVRRAVAGIGFYGNCMGIPTISGELDFHSSYNGNCLVNAFALGTVAHEKIFRGYASGVGNTVVYVGSKTGRDGIHGASMASESFDDQTHEKLPAVQVGDPFQEKLLLEACLEIFESGVVVGVQDMGAAGLTSSSFEMAERSGTGIRMTLDEVPMRETGMNPYELMLSESQERMLFVVERGKEQKLQAICDRWELDATVIGEVISDPQIELHWNGERVSTIPLTILDVVPELDRPYAAESAEARAFEEAPTFRGEQLTEQLLALASNLRMCSRKPIYQQYDSSVRGDTVMPCGSSVGIVRVRKSELELTNIGLAMSVDCDSSYCKVDPRLGSVHAVFEGFRKLSAAGATPLALSDCLNFGSPQKLSGMRELVEAIGGMKDACEALDIPVISGNVSLYNETHDVGVNPTPMIAMVGKRDLSTEVPLSSFALAGHRVFVIGNIDPSAFGAGLFAEEILGEPRCALPEVNVAAEILTGKVVRDLSARGLLSMCRPVGRGGLAMALAKACTPDYRSSVGVELSLPDAFTSTHLFAESSPLYVLASSVDTADKVESTLREHDVPLVASGSTGGENLSIPALELSLPLATLRQSYEQPLRDFLEMN